MKQINMTARMRRCLTWLYFMILLVSATFFLSGCGTGTGSIPPVIEVSESSGNSKDQAVIEKGGIREIIPVFAEEITNATEKKYLSFVEFMDSRSTQPKFAFGSVDQLSERDKFEFAMSIGSFLAERNPEAENEPVSIQKDGRTIYRIPVDLIAGRVKVYLDSSFDPLAAFGASRGSMAGDDFLLGYDQEHEEYIFQEKYNQNMHSGDEYGRYGLLCFSKTLPHHYAVQVGFYKADYPAEENLAQYSLQYTYGLMIEEDAADPEQFTVRSSIFTKYEPDGNIKILDTPWYYQTSGWSEDSERVLMQMDNLVTKPGDEMSYDEAMEQFMQLLPAGFDVRMWYLDNDAQSFAPGVDKPMTIDNRENWFPIGWYISIDQMKTATRTVLSKNFCENLLYPNAFENSETAKYKEFNLQIYMNQDTGGVEDYIIFRLESAVVVKQEAGAITITVPYSPQSAEIEKKFLFDFIIINENGRWVFDNWPAL